MKVAFVYDRVNKWGGAERVLLALHKIFPDAPLYTSVYHPEKAEWARVFDVRTSFVQKFPFAKSFHELYATSMPLAFESFSFDGYDLVISVTSEAAKGIITRPGTLHICYCLTPTRYLWSGYGEYFKNPILRFISAPFVWYLRAWDKIASQRPDRIIAISKEVQKRIKKYYGRDSEIIYPPVMINSYSASVSQPVTSNVKRQAIREAKTSTQDDRLYFLIVSRLVPYKKIDLAVSVFNKLDLPLKIIGKGSEESRLKAMAKSNVEFLGNLTDSDLVKYYKGCRALIFPGIEDFGLSILEAQSFGKPVIAYRQGGALESVVPGKTGILFAPQTSGALEKAVKKFLKMSSKGGSASGGKFDPRDCVMNAQKFSLTEFKRKLEEAITNN
ncbi:MAG: hypothetical protein A2629_00440 [Candidatus Levybacteria bacterium RIFCSPHIGHO2_01_FULL_41_15]|nr:MAG: hypothetical protein A2629_00440 [Candidatus Levybacteria bacterium RIFCSPHIGHO2_01_FULL_41_15]